MAEGRCVVGDQEKGRFCPTNEGLVPMGEGGRSRARPVWVVVGGRGGNFDGNAEGTSDNGESGTEDRREKKMGKREPIFGRENWSRIVV